MGASVKAGSPVDCRAASGPKPDRRTGEEEARRRGALRAVAPTISGHFRLEKPGMKSVSISLSYGKYNAFFFLSKSANSFLYISKTAASI